MSYKFDKTFCSKVSLHSDEIKAYALYIFVKHYSEAGNIHNWRFKKKEICEMTCIRSWNTILKRIKKGYEMGLYHSIEEHHLRAVKMDSILEYHDIDLTLKRTITVRKKLIRNIKDAEDFIRALAIDNHHNNQAYKERISCAKRKLGLTTDNTEKLSRGLSKFVKKVAKGVDDLEVSFNVGTGRKKIGSYFDRSKTTAQRYIKRLKAKNFIDDRMTKAKKVFENVNRYMISYKLLEAQNLYKTFSFWKNGSVYIKKANSVTLNHDLTLIPTTKYPMVSI